jgi:hypothetical protein
MIVAFRSAKGRGFRGAKGDGPTVVESPILTFPAAPDDATFLKGDVMNRAPIPRRVLVLGLLAAAQCQAADQISLPLHVSWGHRTAAKTPFHVGLKGAGIAIAGPKGEGLEAGDGPRDGAWQTDAGGGDVDGISVTLRYADVRVQPINNLHVIWRDLIAASDADTARRLQLDPAYRRDPRKLTVQLGREGTRGFSVTVDQLLQNRVFWVPAFDVYLAAGSPPLSFADHQKSLAEWKPKRILDQVAADPEATYAEYTARWEDMGGPAYVHGSQPAPGHIVGLTWDSAVPKFGIDRGAGAWNDYGNPDRFRLSFDFGDIPRLKGAWKRQRLTDGLPVITTTIERDGVRYEVEQFAYPLDGPPAERRGDIGMVLLQKVRVTNLQQQPKQLSLGMTHRREFPAGEAPKLAGWDFEGGGFVVEERGAKRVLLSVQGIAPGSCEFRADAAKTAGEKKPQFLGGEARLRLDLGPGASREFIVKLPSPPVAEKDHPKLLALEYAPARQATLKFWSDYVARGAQFRVPEKVVNDLFRANLWHALRLPRRHGGQTPDVKIDLPYSNFAYDQHGTPWPVNQAVYVDYMLYDLRGYHDIANEELRAIYRNNQTPDGHVGGFANWGVYTPSMMYTSANHFLLSQDRPAFERLLPQTLKALDWCLAEIRRSPKTGPAAGLVRAPVNDLTGEGVWAFNQAYVYAGMERLGRALQQIGHARSAECLNAAAEFRQSVHRAFASASVQSPLVQLRDHTWIPYVPCEVFAPRRLLDIWYPTDVDSGAVHLLRLKAIAHDSALADFLLHDHEDNLFYKGWGMANEPVYNQQATAYLDRDDAKAAIRAFYSMMACAFSHSALEPVEHRWTWGQYFGPPSTDGAWFELYRNMLLREVDDNTLLVFQAAPRAWFADGQRIEIERAPTWFGKFSACAESRAAAGAIQVRVDVHGANRPTTLLVRVRHPEAKPMRSVNINGEAWTQFDAAKEWVAIHRPEPKRYCITVQY